MIYLRAIFGMVVFLGLCYLFSTDRKRIDWRLVGGGLLLQIFLAVMMLKVPQVYKFFEFIVDGFRAMIASSEESAQFMFGDLAIPGNPYGFAFFVLPTIVFFSVVSAALYYLGILQKVVYLFAWVMRKTMRMSGAESLAAAANVFIGQTEAPLVVKPYLESMSRSELLCLMTGGMATIAGGVFGAYMAMLGGGDPEAQRIFGVHLLTASIISAPAAIVTAKILLPESDPDRSESDMAVPRSAAGANFLDALARGTTDGLKLAVNVGAMLLAFMALIYLANRVFYFLGDFTTLNSVINESTSGQFGCLSLEYVLGMIFAPFAWLLGVESSEILLVGQMLGEKTILNEFVAYASLTEAKEAGIMSQRSIIICTYALCGFANFASIGIQIGGISAIAPGQRKNLTQLGLRALLGGTIACFLTAIIAGAIV